MSNRFNAVRALRLQLKSGFLKTEPPEYNFMRKYPPMLRTEEATKIQKRKIPYLGLYSKVVESNPSYFDDKIYPAYWQHEPISMVLAKKQYEYIQNGLSEEDALSKAKEYVYDLEAKSYSDMKDVHNSILENEAKVPFSSEPAVSAEIFKWQAIVKENSSYESLSLADQGEIDFFIQTKILKWNEVERERRMRDPAFATHFDYLRSSLFPDSNSYLLEKKQKEIKAFRDNVLLFHEIDPNHVNPLKPFFVEDYLTLYNNALKQPLLRRWDSEEKQKLIVWIHETLVYRSIYQKKSSMGGKELENYINELRNHFFPMFRFPDKVKELPKLKLQQIKEALYHNDIGYKKDNGKLFVKRFYKLPSLVFPSYVFLTNEEIVEEENITKFFYYYFY
jgi:hypothetical protein